MIRPGSPAIVGIMGGHQHKTLAGQILCFFNRLTIGLASLKGWLENESYDELERVITAWQTTEYR